MKGERMKYFILLIITSIYMYKNIKQVGFRGFRIDLWLSIYKPLKQELTLCEVYYIFE